MAEQFPSKPSQPHSTLGVDLGSKIAYGFAGFVLSGTLLLTPFAVTPFLRARLPYQHTPREKLKDGFEMIARNCDKRSLMALTQKLRFVDLGSGAGEATIMATQKGYQALGVEINPTLIIISELKKMRQFGLFTSSSMNCEFRSTNLLSLDYSKFDVLFMFGK
uniref:Methyltransferase domain-containing protein n=1 Tax=Corethron hystrix TaxID=216773 RepID=A0A7S1G0V7_9STRA